ncbi:sulfurtransferase TusA family protein [Caldalkalibacillus salinus]|uniref:sulfurtransferase TusA family protein n=1 Tax=Caldalkalibacillus salinus TaxID=2803787 RepID=UPI0019225DB7|nr:sulfurtransferase TusA family protein [Caldalkalibacillus salinus]
MSMSQAELEALHIDHEVDGMGEVCPHTLNIALAALKKAQSGEIVVESTDHSIATKTVPAAVQMNGIADVLGIVESNGTYHIYMKKK